MVDADDAAKDADDAAKDAARAEASRLACDGTRPTGFYDLIAVLTDKGRSSDSGHYESCQERRRVVDRV